MSAPAGTTTPKVSSDLALLAPAFRAAVERALAQCAAQGIEAKVFEAYRGTELQALYYRRGRTVIPPPRPVTNARTHLRSWHGYGLAVDVVHRARLWTPEGGERWFRAMAEVFQRHGCKWGGDWSRPDTPHLQWASCKPSPSDLAREIIAREGVAGVWKAVDAG